VLFGILSQRLGSRPGAEQPPESARVIPAQLSRAGTLLTVLTLCGGCVVVPSNDTATMGPSPAGHSMDCGTAVCESGYGPEAPDGCKSPACSGTHAGGATEVGDAVIAPDLLAATLSVGGMALGMVGHVANFFLPAAAIGPAEVPPPGRFHPVPTRPVFYPAGSP
jgi:hypothetical protein